MIARWIGLGAGLALVIMFAGWQWQVANLRAELLACKTAQSEANEAVLKAREDGREQGRIAALADGERLRADEAERRAMLEATIEGLQAITARLRAPQPPVRVMVESDPPVVVTPPVASCALDRAALDELTGFLNRGRP